MTELAFADPIAAVDGLSARTAALAERISRLAAEGPGWPTVARAAALSRRRHADRVGVAPRAVRRLAAL